MCNVVMGLTLQDILPSFLTVDNGCSAFPRVDPPLYTTVFLLPINSTRFHQIALIRAPGFPRADGQWRPLPSSSSAGLFTLYFSSALNFPLLFCKVHFALSFLHIWYNPEFVALQFSHKAVTPLALLHHHQRGFFFVIVIICDGELVQAIGTWSASLRTQQQPLLQLKLKLSCSVTSSVTSLPLYSFSSFSALVVAMMKSTAWGESWSAVRLCKPHWCTGSGVDGITDTRAWLYRIVFVILADVLFMLSKFTQCLSFSQWWLH